MSWAAVIGAGGAIIGGAAGGGLLGGGSKAPKTSKWYKQNVKDMYGQAADIASEPFTPYTDPRFAEFSPDQTAGFDMVRGNLGLGSGAVNQAVSGVTGAAGYTPQQVSANYNPAAINAQTVASGYNQTPITANYNYAPNQVGAGSVSAKDIQAKNFTDFDISKYMNPYTSQVIDTTLSDLDRDRQRTTNAQKADMMASNAWGGSRSGVAQALTNEGYGNTAASTAAALRNQGFNTASNLISQDANRGLAASQSNQATQLQAGMTNASLGLQAALANQSAGMQNAQFGSNLGMQAQLANQQGNQFGAGLNMQGQIANQGANMQAQLANQQAGQFGAGLDMQGQLANQGAGLQANQQSLQGYNLLGQLGAQQQQMGTQDAQNLLTIGNQQQAQSQQPLDFAYQQWLQQQQWPKDQLTWQSSFLKDPRGTAPPPAAGNTGLGVLGGATTGYNIANGIMGAYRAGMTPTANLNVPYSPGASGPYAGGYMNPTPFDYINSGSYSDRRLKRNISRIGTTPGGQAWYKFDYVWGEHAQGVMADESPLDAVSYDRNGFALVDYARIR